MKPAHQIYKSNLEVEKLWLFDTNFFKVKNKTYVKLIYVKLVFISSVLFVSHFADID